MATLRTAIHLLLILTYECNIHGQAALWLFVKTTAVQMPGVGSRRLVNTVNEGLVKHNGQCVGGQRGKHVSVHSNIALDADHSHCSAAGSMMAPGVHRPLQIVARPPKLAVLLTLQIP